MWKRFMIFDAHQDLAHFSQHGLHSPIQWKLRPPFVHHCQWPLPVPTSSMVQLYSREAPPPSHPTWVECSSFVCSLIPVLSWPQPSALFHNCLFTCISSSEGQALKAQDYGKFLVYLQLSPWIFEYSDFQVSIHEVNKWEKERRQKEKEQRKEKESFI